jgi:predicted AAA+ superfamily ATPase
VWYEWVVAQELWRRAAIRGDESPEQMAYWRSSDHEIDFVVNKESFIEVKRGACSPMEFTWFAKMFPGAHLIVVNANRFDTAFCTGITLQDFLLESGD